MKKQPRPTWLPSIEEVWLMLQCWYIDGVQVHKCMEKSEIKIFKDQRLWYQVLNQHCRDDHMMAYRFWCQKLYAEKGAKVLKDTIWEPIRKIYFSWWRNVFGYKSHGITARYNYCEVYNLRVEECWQNVTLEWKAKWFLIHLVPKRRWWARNSDQD